ncbi:MAG: DUF389 domain-containing protein [Bacteroidales bacterium]|nr:DUF389 domain-containing protein [Bacteroidales bacterium]
MENATSIWGMIRRKFRELANINDYIDRDSAPERIKDGIWFRGPNIWILALSIIVASVGLNVNSTAVIIGAMLISPLMGPIVGVGFSLGTQDTSLMEQAVKNLIIMVTISLLVSCVYFIVTPLHLVDPTELEARTRPTIYDVLIALFGGLAGILETCRKERGTVISGVAIATALMPPLCTAGYGLAHLSPRFFFGALFLFLINTAFIILATFVMVTYLKFPKIVELDSIQAKKRKNISSTAILVIILLSMLSGINVIRDNNFTRNVEDFVSEVRTIGKTYIYHYSIYKDHGRKLRLELIGEPLSHEDSLQLFSKAESFKIKEKQLVIGQQAIGMTGSELQNEIEGVYQSIDVQMMSRDAQIQELRSRVNKLDSLLKVLSDTTAKAPVKQ